MSHNAKWYKKLAKDVNAILDEIRQQDIVNEPINWGDLHCAQIDVAQTVYPDADEPGIVISIEKAGPRCVDLQDAVENKLAERGYINDLFIVVTSEK